MSPSSGIRKVTFESCREPAAFVILRRMTNPWYDLILMSPRALRRSVWFISFAVRDSVIAHIRRGTNSQKDIPDDMMFLSSYKLSITFVLLSADFLGRKLRTFFYLRDYRLNREGHEMRFAFVQIVMMVLTVSSCTR